jgi:hypothetical protein
MKRGLPEVTASGLLAAMDVFDLIGTTASGWLTDRWGSRYLLAWYYGLPPPMVHTAARHPWEATSEANNGRKTSWPVAVLAVNRPITRPRWRRNHRFAT